MLEALGLGSCAAFLWGASIICSAPASRQAGPASALLWGSLVAVGFALVAALPTGPPSGDLGDWGLVLLIGVAYTAGVSLWLIAVRTADISVLTPIVATDGGIAVVFAIATGADVSVAVLLALGGMVIGVAVIAAAGVERTTDAGGVTSGASRHLGTIGLALVIASCFGLVFFASGKTDAMNPLWVVALSRSLTCLLAAGVCIRRRVPFPRRRNWKWIVPFGIFDVFGFVALVVGTRISVPVASVAASQYAAVAALGGVIYLGERIRRVQLLGVALVLTAAATVAALGG